MGKLSRDKGERAMLEVQHILTEVFPAAQKRSQYRGARKDGCDIEGTPYWVEVKHCARITPAMVGEWVKQALSETNGRPVTVWFRGDRQQWRVAHSMGPGRVLIEERDVWMHALRDAYRGAA